MLGASDGLFGKAHMRTTALLCVCLLAWTATSFAASPKVPQRNMTVELRVIPQPSATGGVVLRSQPEADAEPTIQKVFVMNGERAQFQVSQSMPVQWVKAAVQQTSTTTAVGGVVTTIDGRGVEQGMTWLDAAQSLVVLPRWPGGRQPAVLEIQTEGAAPETRANGNVQSNVPGQSRSRLATTVQVPLGEWFTLGVSGARAAPEKTGVYASQSSEPSAVRLLQVRVLAP